MKVLFVNIFYSPTSYGGATIVLEELCKHYSAAGEIIPIVISAGTRSDLQPYTVMKIVKDGVTNYVINLPSNRSTTQQFFDPKVNEIFSELINLIKPTLVNIHCIQGLGAGLIEVAKNLQYPVILSTHDFWWLCERQFMITGAKKFCAQEKIDPKVCKDCVVDFAETQQRNKILEANYKLADLVTFPSQYARDIHVKSGFDSKKCEVLENGINLPKSDFFEKQTKRRKADQTVTFGFLGGPSHIKGWPLIKDAFKKLGDVEANFKVIVVDGGVWEKWWSKHHFSDLPGEWEIYPRFSQDEIDEFYANIDVLLFLSQWKETFGLTIREATSRGVRVIQTNSGGTTEHSHFVEKEALPIGNYPDELSTKLLDHIARGTVHKPPSHPISYADQAQVLTLMMQKVLEYSK